MKKIISVVLISAMMLSLSSCYSERMISSPKNLNEVQDSDIIVSVETKDGFSGSRSQPGGVYCLFLQQLSRVQIIHIRLIAYCICDGVGK